VNIFKRLLHLFRRRTKPTRWLRDLGRVPPPKHDERSSIQRFNNENSRRASR
jgi:hypothetical protein